jgi:Zn-dependent protease with chaperone function
MYLPLAAGVVLWTAARPLGRRLAPALAVPLLTAATLITALATGFVLAVAGLFALAQLPQVAGAGHWSTRVLGAHLPVPRAFGVLAGLVVCGLLMAAVRRAAQAGRDLVRAARVCRRLGPSVAGLVVVDDELPDAYAVPGIGGRVVVSTAMLRALPADERRVLLAHEAAHLRHRHHWYVQAAELAAAANPLLRPAARAVRAAVERWADEVAAAEVGDRSLAARALARAGLARAAARRGPGRTPSTALPGVDDGVVERVQALLAGPPPRRRALSGALGALMLVTITATLITGVDTEDEFELAQSAYTTIG